MNNIGGAEGDDVHLSAFGPRFDLVARFRPHPGSLLLRTASLLLAIVLLSCGAGHGEDTLNPAENTAVFEELEASIGIPFPEGVTLLEYERQTDSDALIRAKLIFTPSQWAQFVRSSPLDTDGFDEEQRYLLGSNVGWWNPQDAEHLPTTQAWLPDAKILNVGIDRSDPNRIVAFLVWHGT